MGNSVICENKIWFKKDSKIFLEKVKNICNCNDFGELKLFEPFGMVYSYNIV